jgi:vacuolar-type H+-ATPase subunit E/Vma4
MDSDSQLTAQLAPLEAALVAAARDEAAKRLRDARATADAARAESAAKARAVVDQAVAEGQRAAERAAARRLVDGRREARTIVLQAQNAAYQRLVVESVAAAEALRDRPEYRDVERRLIETAKRVLGADATIVSDPDQRGGVRASSGGRALDLTLPTLARQCVERLGQEVTRLWA